MNKPIPKWRQKRYDKRKADWARALLKIKTSKNPKYKTVPNYPKHRVGEDGTIWVFRFDRKSIGRWKQIKGTTFGNRSGHLRVDLGVGIDGSHKFLLLHRLILETFKGSSPVSKPLCLHKDDNPQNNKLKNLRWGTYKENELDRQQNWKRSGRKHKQGWRKIDAEQLAQIKSSTKSSKQLAREFKVCRHHINKLLRGW